MNEERTPLFQVDAFTSEPFRGNPAAVCLLDRPRDERWMQNVATEMNLSETAYLFENGDGFDLRWYTPAREVPLCGHATLASAHVLWETGTLTPDRDAVFHTKSGRLTATREGDDIVLDFPAHVPEPAEAPSAVKEAIPADVVSCQVVPKDLGEVNYLLELESEQAVRSLRPVLSPLRAPGSPGVMITARGSEYDFVSRYFVPWAGIDEDPVTGSAHCVLAPYWSPKLGKERMTAYQASARGGVVGVELAGDRVRLLAPRGHDDAGCASLLGRSRATGLFGPAAPDATGTGPSLPPRSRAGPAWGCSA